MDHIEKAIWCGDVESIRSLIAAGDLEEAGLNCLHWACYYTQPVILSELLFTGLFDPGTMGSGGETFKTLKLAATSPARLRSCGFAKRTHGDHGEPNPCFDELRIGTFDRLALICLKLLIGNQYIPSISESKALEIIAHGNGFRRTSAYLEDVEAISKNAISQFDGALVLSYKDCRLSFPDGAVFPEEEIQYALLCAAELYDWNVVTYYQLENGESRQEAKIRATNALRDIILDVQSRTGKRGLIPGYGVFKFCEPNEVRNDYYRWA